MLGLLHTNNDRRDNQQNRSIEYILSTQKDQDNNMRNRCINGKGRKRKKKWWMGEMTDDPLF